MGRFLKDDDYEVQIRSEISRIIDPTQGKTKILKAELMAIAQIKAYLSGRFAVDQIFVDAPLDEIPESDPRDPYIVMITIDIALYHLWSKEGPNNIPKTRELRYNDALEWLQAVQKGQAVDLPPIVDQESGQPTFDVRIWSRHEPESNRY